jgi:hypothetical protein
MPTHIQAPDGTVIEFPDSMKDPDITAAMGKLYPGPSKPSDEHTVLGFVKNLLTSGMGMAGNIGHALVHPIDTMQGMADVVAGGASKLGVHPPGKPLTAEEGKFTNLVNDYKQHYGSLHDIGETLYHDPARVGSDVAALAGGAGGVLKGGSRLAEAASLPRAASALNAGSKVAGVVGDVANPATLPLMGVGAGLKAVGPPLAESALGIRGQTHAFGATPGKAVLEETRGIRPSTIERSAQSKLGELNNALEGRAANTRAPASLVPARTVLENASAKAAGANSAATPAELSPMAQQLTEPRPGFTGATEYAPGAHTPISFQQQPVAGLVQPSGAPVTRPQLVRGPSPEPVVAAEQTPLDLLKMKRQFGQDFVNWNPVIPRSPGANTVGRQAYHALAQELNDVVPGAESLNQRISSLVPVAQRAKLTDLNAGPIQRGLNRFAAPTGGMIPALFGLREGGLPGLMTMIAGQETLGSPAVRMAAARGLFGGGKFLGSPTLRRSLPLVNTGERGQ